MNKQKKDIAFEQRIVVCPTTIPNKKKIPTLVSSLYLALNANTVLHDPMLLSFDYSAMSLVLKP